MFQKWVPFWLGGGWLFRKRLFVILLSPCFEVAFSGVWHTSLPWHKAHELRCPPCKENNSMKKDVGINGKGEGGFVDMIMTVILQEKKYV